MRIAASGSIATDWLMTFPGRISEQFVEGKLDRVSLSFLVDELEVRRGGTAANIAFGLAQFGVDVALVGSVGQDFNADYRHWLDESGVDTSCVAVSHSKHTARFLCTTDDDQNQIASFYTGAMEEARRINISKVAQESGGFDLVVLSPDDPTAMINHTNECRREGIPFVADPGQQIARMSGLDVRHLIDGADLLLTNEYERQLMETKTGWSDQQILEKVGMRITTIGSKGSILQSRDGLDERVPTVPERRRTDPTGVGDGFRAGFLAAMSWGLPPVRAAQVGSLTATYILEHVGTQEYTLERTSFLDRFITTYGREAGSELETALVIR